MIYAIDGLKSSRLRLQVTQELESWKNRLLALPFDSPKLVAGTQRDKEKGFSITREVRILAPGLKKIKVTVAFKNLTRKIQFYKSRYIYGGGS